MSNEQTTALIVFSGRRNETSGRQVQLCLGTEGSASEEAPFAFTITIANVIVSLAGPPPAQGTVNITERIPLSRADIEKLRGWINQVAPAGR